MKIRILAADSMGVRSLATVVEISGLKIFLDPGASLAPRRYGLPPHPIEIETLEHVIDEILDEMKDSDYVFISHYHYDHYLYKEEHREAYRGKNLLIKHPVVNVNVNQRIRAHRLLKKMGVENIARRVIIADGKQMILDSGIEVEFSEPVPHGPDGTKLGSVLMIKVKGDDETFVYASDVQGPISVTALSTLIKWRPNMLLLSGPPTYFEGYRISEGDVNKAVNNLIELLRLRSTKVIVMDHHTLRDLNYREKLRSIFSEACKLGKMVLNAAEYMGRPVMQLEAQRRTLWEGH